MQEKDIDQLFKQQLSSLEMPPSDRVWAGIEGGLNASGKRRGVVWFIRWGAAAAVILLAGLFLLGPGSDPSPDSRLAVQPVSEGQDSSTVFEDNHPTENSLAAGTHVGQGAEGQKGSGVDKLDMADGSGGGQGLTASAAMKGLGKELSGRASAETGSSRSEDGTLAEGLKSLLARDRASMVDVDIEAPGLVEVSHRAEPAPGLERFGVSQAGEGALARAFRPRVTVGGEYSPTYAFREVSGGSAASGVGAYAENGLMTSSGGLKVSVQMHRRWSLETGVRYAMLGQVVTASSSESKLYSMNSAAGEGLSFQNIDLGNSMGNIRTPDVPKSSSILAFDQSLQRNEVVEFFAGSPTNTQADIEQSLGYVEVPLTMRYKLFERGFSLSVSGGLSSNWLVDNRVSLSSSGQKRDLGKTQGLSNLSFSTHAGVAVSLPLYHAFTLQMEPRISYFLSDINKDYPTSFKPYSFGVFTGIYFSFGE